MRQLTRKRILFYPKAEKDLKKFPIKVQAKIRERTNTLAMFGYLNEPEAKKLDEDIFEIRVKLKGAWRAFYTYMDDDLVVILHVISKKTQSTPINDLNTARSRLKLIES